MCTPDPSILLRVRRWPKQATSSVKAHRTSAYLVKNLFSAFRKVRYTARRVKVVAELPTRSARMHRFIMSAYEYVSVHVYAYVMCVRCRTGGCCLDAFYGISWDTCMCAHDHLVTPTCGILCLLSRDSLPKPTVPHGRSSH